MELTVEVRKVDQDNVANGIRVMGSHIDLDVAAYGIEAMGYGCLHGRVYVGHRSLGTTTHFGGVNRNLPAGQGVNQGRLADILAPENPADDQLVTEGHVRANRKFRRIHA